MKRNLHVVISEKITNVALYPEGARAPLLGTNMSGIIDAVAQAVLENLLYDYGVLIFNDVHDLTDILWYPTEEERDSKFEDLSQGYPYYKFQLVKRIRQGHIEYQDQ